METEPISLTLGERRRSTDIEVEHAPRIVGCKVAIAYYRISRALPRGPILFAKGEGDQPSFIHQYSRLKQSFKILWFGAEF